MLVHDTVSILDIILCRLYVMHILVISKLFSYLLICSGVKPGLLY